MGKLLLPLLLLVGGRGHLKIVSSVDPLTSLLLPAPRSITYPGGDASGRVCLSASSLAAPSLTDLKPADRDVVLPAFSSLMSALRKKWPAAYQPPGDPPTIGKVEIQVTKASSPLTSETDESYHLTVEGKGQASGAKITIQAATAYGVRHAIATLTQLVALQPAEGQNGCGGTLPALPIATIQDAPRFRHRGVMLDTARHFLPLPLLQKTIDGMAMVKLNVLHWHLVDGNSFPFVPPSHPELGQKGSYGPDQVYQAQDVKAIVDYAQKRGVRVVIEVDTPGHFYSWGLGMPDIVMCNTGTFHTDAYCSGPPCGYLKVDSPQAVQVVQDVFNDLMAITIDDTFHVGCDEITPTCYGGPQKTAKLLRDYASKLEATVKAKGRTVIAWADSVLAYETPLDNRTTILHAWSAGPVAETSQIVQATNAGYRVIDSASEALYLDCGTGGYVNGWKSWCDPYKTWQTVYLHEPTTGVSPSRQHLVEGAEVTAWGEKIDGDNLDLKVWPRAAALAERLWSSVDVRDVLSAQSRLRRLRGALRSLLGIASTPLMPQSCDDEEGLGAKQCDSGYSTYFAANIPDCTQDANAARAGGPAGHRQGAWQGTLLDSVTGGPIAADTSVSACLGTAKGGSEASGYAALRVTWAAQDNQPWSPAKQCNEVAILDADAVGMLIGSGFDDPTTYLELVFNPNGAVLVSVVTQTTNGTVASRQREVIGCDEARDQWGLTWDVSSSSARWDVSATVPLPLVAHYLGGGLAKPSEDGSQYFRVGLFRIDVPEHTTLSQDYPADEGWFPYNPQVGFSSWQPTWAYPPPASLHVPKYFGLWRVAQDVLERQGGAGNGTAARNRNGMRGRAMMEIPAT